jgi:hypothetical protein
MQRYGKTDDEAHDWIKERWEHYGTWNWGFSDFLMSEWGNK